jgi:hypothetical protein
MAETNIEITSDNNTITNKIEKNNDMQQKQLKTNTYTLNAVKKYRLKNAEKVKEYNKLYIKKKREEKIKLNPYIEFNKQQLYDKIFELEQKIKELELKY